MKNVRRSTRIIVLIGLISAIVVAVFIAVSRSDEGERRIETLANIIGSDPGLITIMILLLALFLTMFIILVSDVSSKSRTDSEDELRNNSFGKDLLTGLDSKIKAGNGISELLSTYASEGACALAMLDLEDMKGVNEAYGHDGGDRLIKNFAKLLREFFSENAYLARTGGNQFIIFLYDFEDKDHVSRIVTDFFTLLSARDFEGIKVKCYVGIAMVCEEAKTYADLLKRAETALFIAKRNRKNRFVFFKNVYEKEYAGRKRKIKRARFTDADMEALMAKDHFEAGDAFTFVLDTYETKTPEELLVRNDEDFILISDVETRTILSVQCRDKEYQKKLEEIFVGKIYDDAVKNEDGEADLSFIDACSHNSSAISEAYIKELETRYLVRTGMGYHDSGDIYCHIFRPIVTPEDMSREYKTAMACQTFVAACASSELSPYEDPKLFFTRLINDVCSFFGAEAGFLMLLEDEHPAFTINIPENEKLYLDIDLSDYARLHWKEKLRDNQVIFIPSTSYEGMDSRLSKFYSDRGIRNSLLVPIWDGKIFYGYLTLRNLSKYFDEVHVMCSIGAMIKEMLGVMYEIENDRSRLYFDDTTGCLSYEGFKKQSEMLINMKSDKHFAICAFDITRFKYINEVFGYDTGDTVLNQVADMVVRSLHKEEFICRITADEFCVMLEYSDIEELKKRLKAIAASVSLFFKYNYEGRMIVDLTMGIYPMEEKSHESVETMMNLAVIAKKKAKVDEGLSIRVYDKELLDDARREIELETNMDHALENEEFKVYLQPQVNIGVMRKDEKIFRAEALCRWIKDDSFYSSPGEFIPLFERDGRIIKLDMYMMERVCRTVKQLKEKEGLGCCIACNVSRATILQPDFMENFKELLNRYEIEPGEIEIEITEGTAIRDYEKFDEVIKKLNAMNVYVAMDDFGSEYSSLNVLQNLSLDVLKLDKKFFENVSEKDRHDAVVKGTIGLAKDLKMMTVAEGIETQDQIAALKEADCDFIQGFVFARPMPVHEYVDWIRKNA